MYLSSAALSRSGPNSNFYRSPPDALKWSHRKAQILREITRSKADIVCLEEVDHFEDFFQPELSQCGFEGIFKAKVDSPCLYVEGNSGPDGCALFYSSSKFSLAEKKEVVLKDLGGKDSHQVALLVKLQPKEEELPMICVAVVHLKAKPDYKENRLAQGKHLQTEMAAFSQGLPSIICGDFNAPPYEPVYGQLSSLGDMKLSSAYATAGGGEEPTFTSWKLRPSRESKYTIDYIWYSVEKFVVGGVWRMPTEADIGDTALPNLNYPSDHVSLCADFQYV